MAQFKRDLYKTREACYVEFTRTLEESNKLWQGVIRLIITLSSSYLLLTIALVDKLFPQIIQVGDVPVFLGFAWVSFFIATIFSIISEIMVIRVELTLIQ